MEEALRLAGRAAHDGRPNEVADVFENATSHLRHATTMHKHHDHRRRRHYSTDELRYASSDSDDLRDHQPNIRSTKRMPASRLKHVGPSRQPVVVERYRNSGKTPVSRQVITSEDSILATPPHAYRLLSPQELAYGSPMRRHARPRMDDPVELHHLGLPSRLKRRPDGADYPQGQSARASTFPTRPEPILPPVRPIPPRTSSRATPSTLPTPSTSQGTSSAVTDHPGNTDLRHPRKSHVSLNQGQDFSLGRHHRRQPIAREWQTARKRLTAAIACLNTVFVGLIVGIYVSRLTWEYRVLRRS